MIDELNIKNPDIFIKDCTDESFTKYGRVLPSDSFQEACSYLKNIEIPETGNSYIADDVNFKAFLSNTDSFDDVFGSMPIQYGYVNGNNSSLNALEYHKSSEMNIAVSPIVLFLGRTTDIIDNVYNSERLEAFYIPAGTTVELYPLVLHYSPCKVTSEGFRCGVILPKNTNVNFIESKNKMSKEDHLLFKTNKWLLAHFENKPLIEKGAHPGLQGTNYKIIL